MKARLSIRKEHRAAIRKNAMLLYVRIIAVQLFRTFSGFRTFAITQLTAQVGGLLQRLWDAR
jgi:hypothetical protein